MEFCDFGSALRAQIQAGGRIELSSHRDQFDAVFSDNKGKEISATAAQSIRFALYDSFEAIGMIVHEIGDFEGLERFLLHTNDSPETKNRVGIMNENGLFVTGLYLNVTLGDALSARVRTLRWRSEDPLASVYGAEHTANRYHPAILDGSGRAFASRMFGRVGSLK